MLGGGLFVYVLLRLGVAEIFSLLLGIGWYFALVAPVYAAHQLVRAAAYGRCVVAEEGASYWDMVRIRFSGEAVQFLTFTGPFLAEPAKVWLLRRRGLRTKPAVAATISEYLIYTFTSAAFALAGLTYLLGNFELSGAVAVAARILVATMGAFLLTSALAIGGRVYLIGGILKAAAKAPVLGKRLRLNHKDVREIEDLLFVVLRDRPARFFSILGLELAAQGFLVLELFLLVRATAASFTAIQPLLVEAASKFVGLAFFFIPGQVGASEGTYAVVFQAVGLEASAGFAVALARRVRSLMVAGVGLLAAPVWREPNDFGGPGKAA